MKSLSHSALTIATISAASLLGACSAYQPYNGNPAPVQAQLQPQAGYHSPVSYPAPNTVSAPRSYLPRPPAQNYTMQNYTMQNYTMPPPTQLNPYAPYGPESAYAPYGAATQNNAGHHPRLRGFKPYGYGTYGATLYDAGGDGVGIQARYGYQFSNFLAAEGEAATGVLSLKKDVGTSSFKDKLDYQLGVFAMARLPVSRQFSLHTRGGYHETKLQHKATIGGIMTQTKDKDDGFAYGAGAQLAITPKNALRLDFTKYEIPGRDLKAVSLAYQTRF